MYPIYEYLIHDSHVECVCVCVREGAGVERKGDGER